MEPTHSSRSAKRAARYFIFSTWKSIAFGVLLCVLVLPSLSFAQINFEVSIDTSTCPGNNNGAISIINVQGGISPYTYSIDSGQTFQASNFFSGLSEDFYFAVVADAGGDTSSAVVISPDPEPTAICERLEVGLETNGMAEVLANNFDAGSLDNCGVLWYRVRRMTDAPSCHPTGNPDNLFFESVKLCCSDLPSDSVIIQFRVYDRDPGIAPVSPDSLTGRYAECMTSVLVRDYLAPEIISCAPDMEADCREDFADLSAFGFPEVEDNCQIVDTLVEVDFSIDQCMTGEIVRRFSFADASGNTDSCTQVISVVNNDAFDGSDSTDLVWPVNFVVYGCGFNDTHPDTTGFPEIVEDECAMVAVSWEDDVYEFAPDACVKIRRHWTVLDWCQYDRGLPRGPDNGVWTYTQEIKLLDTVPPVISGPNDTLVKAFNQNCNPIMVQLPPIEVIDCADSADLKYQIEVDLHNDGIIDRFISGNDASDSYPHGEHLIRFIVDDRCNNSSTWETIVLVEDGKKPNAVIVNKLILPLIQMAQGPMTSIAAWRFNLSSYDNCSPGANLQYSFSSDPTDTIRVYDCDSLGSRPVQIWVTDEAGNQSVANTYAIIQDNEGVCPVTITASINGQVIHNSGAPLGNIELRLEGKGLEESTTSDKNGLYAFSSIAANQAVEITPKSPTSWSEGVSTLDLILIQQHILASRTFDDPYSYIAADADGSGHISTRDIIWLRKLILGNIQSVPGNSSWRFVDNTYQFANPSAALDYDFPEKCELQASSGMSQTGFTAVKVGDINGDAKKNLRGDIAGRSGKTWRWEALRRTSHHKLEYVVRTSRPYKGYGFQLELEGFMLQQGNVLAISPGPGLDARQFHWSFSEAGVRLHYADAHAFELFEGEEIFTISLSNQWATDELIIHRESQMQNEHYENDLVLGEIELRQIQDSEFEMSIVPNPSGGSSEVVMRAVTAGEYIVNVYTSAGMLIRTIDYRVENGEQSRIPIRIPEGYPSGIYLVSVSGPDGKGQFIKWQCVR